jgi:hypothetical protein
VYIPYQFMEAAHDDRLRAAARNGHAAVARREHRRLRRARREQQPARRPGRRVSPRTAG